MHTKLDLYVLIIFFIVVLAKIILFNSNLLRKLFMAHTITLYKQKQLVWFMVFKATFNNILVISWRSVLLVEETG